MDCKNEKNYIFTWVLTEILGIEYKVVFYNDVQFTTFRFEGTSLQLIFSDNLFSDLEKNWGSKLSVLNSSLEDVIINNESNSITTQTFLLTSQVKEDVNNGINIKFDLFGSIFYMISRYEEMLESELDKHLRFQSINSLSRRLDFLHRPLVNEYIDVLWNCISLCDNTIERKERKYKTLPSHDIDFPSYFWNKQKSEVIKKCVGDIIRRKSVTQAYSRYSNWLKFYSQGCKDPFDNINWICDQSTNRELKSSFYYIPIKTHKNDYGMPLSHELVSKQFKYIINNGHEIGFHPGYDTFRSRDNMTRSLEELDKQLKSIGAPKASGGRQHVLRWHPTDTAKLLDNLDIEYDSTLGYADVVGFRCGTCYSFPMYDLVDRKALRIRQRPLITMDVTLTSPQYMNLKPSDAYNMVIQLKDKCKQHQGDFTLLWHNTELLNASSRELYTAILDH